MVTIWLHRFDAFSSASPLLVRPALRLHEVLGNAQIFHINDVIPTFHRIRLMTAYFHTNHLRYSGPTHIAYRCSTQIMELEFGHSRFLARFLP